VGAGHVVCAERKGHVLVHHSLSEHCTKENIKINQTEKSGQGAVRVHSCRATLTHLKDSSQQEKVRDVQRWLNPHTFLASKSSLEVLLATSRTHICTWR
jgi:hypothetical protein